MRRSPNPWPIGLREPKSGGSARNTCCGRMVGPSESGAGAAIYAPAIGVVDSIDS